MNSTEVKLALGALLCSIGKLYYRGSLISAEEYGYTALNSIIKISDPDILNTVRYHKLSDKFKDSLEDSSFAYIVNLAKRIADSSDFKKHKLLSAGKKTPLKSIFNRLNDNSGNSFFAPQILGEEKDINYSSNANNDISFDKIIKEEQNSINLNRNKKNDKATIDSGIETSDLKEISNSNNHIKSNVTKSNDKNEKNKYVYNNIVIGNRDIKIYKKENINNRLNLTGVENNSYLYKKLQSLMIKEDKINKFINKKPKNKDKNIGKETKTKIKNNLVLNNGNKNFTNFKKINLNLNFSNKRLQTQESKNVNINDNYINSTFSGTNSYKNSNSHLKVIDEYNTRNNNIKVQNINNYIIDVHKYKINLIGNSNYYKDMNLLEFYKKLNNPNRYNKFILNTNKKNIPIKSNNNNDNEYKLNYLNQINNKRSINKYLSNENNNSKLSKIRHLSDLDISPNHYANYHLKTEWHECF